MKPIVYAKLLAADYENVCPHDWTHLDRLVWGKASARVIEKGGFRLGLITGTNDIYDMLVHDALMAIPWKGDTRWWGMGGYIYASKVYGFMKAMKINALAGHSIGGTVAQIIGSSLRVETSCFNPARSLIPFQRQPVGADMVTNYLTKDIINRLPPWNSHVGRVVKINAMGHSIRTCIRGLRSS